MNAGEAFSRFVRHALRPARAERYAVLSGSAKGQRRLLRYLDHDFAKSVRPAAHRRAVDRRVRCYAFHGSVGFGAEFTTVAEAHDRLRIDDGWLIVVCDGSAGIYRPESRWDMEIEIAC